jgi:hypothetical protein
MAGKGIVINFISDIRRFLKGTDDVGKALEEVSDSLDDVAREGEGATEQLERSFKDLTKVIDTETDDAARKMARNIDRGTDAAKRDLDELRQESRQNFAETFSSFDGSMESLLDGIQGTLGGVTAGLGSIPAFAAAAVGAAGLGLVTGELVRQQEEANKLRENLANAYRQAAEEGRDYLDTAQIIAEATDILLNPDRRGELDRYKSEAERIGVDINTYIQARAGDLDALAYSIEQAQTAEARRAGELIDTYGTQGKRIDELSDGAYAGLIYELEKLSGQHIANRDAAALYADFVSETSRAESVNIGRVRDAEQQRWDALGRSYDEAASRGPITIATELAPPNPDSIRRSTEGTFDRTPIRVRARLVTREGKEISG